MNPPRDGNDDTFLQTRFQNVVRGLVLYLQARHRLFSIEAGEAGAILSKKLILILLALALVGFGYGLFLTGAVVVISQWTGVSWYFLCLLLAPAHLLAAYGCLCLARRPPPRPLFQESVNELAKDREWLSNPTRPWW